MPEPLATAVGPGAVRLERLLPGPIERIWEYLVDPELRGTWLAAGPMEGRVGGAVTLRFRHADLSPEREDVPERYRRMAETGHEMHGVVTAWEPPRLLRYTWDDEDDASEVTFELAEQGDGVLLVVTQRRLDGRAALVSVGAGWHTHLAILRDRLEGRDPPGFWGAHERLEREYAERFAATPERLAPPGAGVLSAASDGRPLIRFERDVDAPLDAAWRAIIDDEQRDRWYPAKLRMEGRVGGWVRERFEGDDTPLPDGTLVSLVPPHHLSFAIKADPGSPEPSVRHPQTLSLRLEDRGGASRLRFEHVFGDRSLAPGMAAGWHSCLDAYDAVAAGRRPRNGGDSAALRDAYRAWFGDVT